MAEHSVRADVRKALDGMESWNSPRACSVFLPTKTRPGENAIREEPSGNHLECAKQMCISEFCPLVDFTLAGSG